MINRRNAKYLSQGCLALSLIVTFVSYNFGLTQAMQGGPNFLIHYAAFGVSVFFVLLSILIPYYANRKR